MRGTTRGERSRCNVIRLKEHACCTFFYSNIRSKPLSRTEKNRKYAASVRDDLIILTHGSRAINVIVDAPIFHSPFLLLFFSVVRLEGKTDNGLLLHTLSVDRSESSVKSCARYFRENDPRSLDLGADVNHSVAASVSRGTNLNSNIYSRGFLIRDTLGTTWRNFLREQAREKVDARMLAREYHGEVPVSRSNRGSNGDIRLRLITRENFTGAFRRAEQTRERYPRREKALEP